MPPQAPYQSHSHQWVRTALLIVSTLAVVGVLFAIYIQYNQNPDRGTDGSVAIRDPAPLAPRPATGTTSQPAADGRGAAASGIRIGDVPVSEGGKIKLNLYPPEGTEARMELEVDSFKASDQSENKMELVRPVIRFRTPSGQLVRVESETGVVELARQRGESYDLSRGKLTGRVRVKMDRLTREEREKLPPEEQDDLTEERLIRAELDDLTFDLEYARVESSGRVFVTLAEAEFEGRGLLLRYDEAASRIEQLKIGQGDHITLRRMGGALAIGLPATAPGAAVPTVVEGEVQPTAATQPATALAEAEAVPPEPAVDEDGVPYFLPNVEGPKVPQPRETATYHAQFDGNVTVDQFDGRNQVGLLTSDRLAFLFDFGQRERDQARLSPASQPAVATPEAVEERDASADTEVKSVVLNWNGPLVVDLVRNDPHRLAGVETPRLQITASGSEVYVADRRGNARCRKLIHHQETKRLWLEGDKEGPLMLDLGESGQLTGQEVYWDGSGNTVSVSGPGRLIEARSLNAASRNSWLGGTPEVGTSIAFDEELKLCLAAMVEERLDPVSGEMVREERQILQTAVLTGNVLMAQGDNRIGGKRVDVTFGPPLKQGSFADNLQTLRVEGGVEMIQGDERISCDTMLVTLGPDPGGRTAPIRALAVGKVSARQGSRYISARDRMMVELESIRVKRPAFDLVQAKVIARQRGLRVEDIDWAQQRQEYESEERFESGLRRLQAFGEVRVEDPQQNVMIGAETLDCAIKEGRQIENGQVVGTSAGPASVAFGDFGVMGQIVDFDASRQWAEVPGAGRLSFLSRQDLDGRAVQKPIPTAITWSKRMSFRGQENKAVFVGSVHAVSEASTFDCRDEMALEFVDEDEREAAAAAVIAPHDWWVLRPWTYRARRDDNRKLEAPPLRKQLTYLTAVGDVVALTATYHEHGGHLKSRARIAGPRLAVDLRNQTQTLNVDGAGTLLIEDYELKVPPAAAAAATRTSPFGAEVSNLPSQTFISWGRAMSYYGSNRLAVFDQSVELAHRSGANLIMAEGVLSHAALDQLKEAEKGRDARLACRQLNVQFRARGEADERAASRGIGGMSGNEVASFAANGGVDFEDSGVSVTSQTITFDRERNLLQILGTEQAPAELIDLRGGRYRSITGPRIYWEREKDEIDAPKAKIRTR